jgi:hypothetical protein
MGKRWFPSCLQLLTIVNMMDLIIGQLLTPLGLCYWIGDDGCFDKRDRVVYLSTNSFALAEVKLLVSVLTDKFGLKCTINKNNGGFRIRISSESLPVLQSLLKDIMPSMMRRADHKVVLARLEVGSPSADGPHNYNMLKHDPTLCGVKMTMSFSLPFSHGSSPLRADP